MADAICGCKAFFYFSFLLIFWVIALWDAAKIIDGFLNDNLSTFVRSVEIEENSNPEFIEDATICVTYKNGTIFDLIWWNDTEKLRIWNETQKDLDDWNVTRRVLLEIFEGNFSNKSDNLNLTQKQLVHAAKFLSSVEEMDQCQYNKTMKSYRGISCFDSPDPVFLMNDQIKKLNIAVRRFLEHETTENISAVELNSFNLYKICTLVHVKDIWTPTTERTTVPIGIRKKSKEIADDQVRNIQIDRILIKYPTYAGEAMTAYSTAYSMSFTVLIGTTTLFDERNISENCVDPVRVPQAGKTCRHTHFVQSMEKNCHCTPLWYRNHNEGNGTLPFCTRTKYNDTCYDDVIKEQQEYKCQHCLTVQSVYGIQEADFIFDRSLDHSDYFYRFEIAFQVVDSFYTRYEGTTKSTAWQTVAQVGGDIGFLTGFSVWALWLVFFYVYKMVFRCSKKPTIAEAKKNRVLALRRATEATFQIAGFSKSKKKREKERWMQARVLNLEEMEKKRKEREERMGKVIVEMEEMVKNLKEELEKRRGNETVVNFAS